MLTAEFKINGILVAVIHGHRVTESAFLDWVEHPDKVGYHYEIHKFNVEPYVQTGYIEHPYPDDVLRLVGAIMKKDRAK